MNTLDALADLDPRATPPPISRLGVPLGQSTYPSLDLSPDPSFDLSPDPSFVPSPDPSLDLSPDPLPAPLSESATALWVWLSATYQTRAVAAPAGARRPKVYEVSAGSSITALTRDWCRANDIGIRQGDRLLEELIVVGKVARVEAGQGTALRPARRPRRKPSRRSRQRGVASQGKSFDRRPRVQKWAFRLVERAVESAPSSESGEMT